MGLLQFLRRILLGGEDDQDSCGGEDERDSYHSIRSSQPTPTYYSHRCDNNYDLERSSKPSSSSSTTFIPPSESKPFSSSHTSSKTFASNCTQNSSLPSSSPSPFLLPSSKPSLSSSKPSSSNISPTHFSIPSSNASSTQNPSLPSSKLSTPSNPFASDASQTHFSIPSSKSKPSSSSHTSAKTFASNCTHNYSLPSSDPSPFLLPSSKPSLSSSKLPSSNASSTHFSIPSSNASSTQNPSLPSSKLSTSSNPFPSDASQTHVSLPSSKSKSSSSSHTSSKTFTSNCTHNSSRFSSDPSPFLLSSSKLSFSSSKPSSNASPPHISIPSSNASSTLNPSLPASKLSASSNPLASVASQTHFSLPSSKFHSASPTEPEKNQCKDLEELNRGTIVLSVSSRPKSPSNASPRETLRFSSKLSGQRYEIPKHLEEQIKKDIAPEVLRRPLSASTYSDYFAALLYAEDFYIEKWSNFLLSGVTLELRRREPFEARRNQGNEKTSNDGKPFVAFEIDKIPERRPYLLSRDFVFARRSSKTAEPFKGILYRVVKSTTVLVEFGDDFRSQHSSSNKYDVSFSFNRVCLKRCHQAISVAKDSSLHDVLFPNLNSTSSAIHLYRNRNPCQLSMPNRILNHEGPLPYFIEGPLSTTWDKLSGTGTAIQEAILKIYSTNPQCRILVCSPTNLTCDALMRSLDKQIPREKLFRANAAFRDYDRVPDDIIPQSLYKEECFACPSESVLRTFSVITSTYVSSFRLRIAGLNADHFTHIFLVDASSAMEPEVVVPLANFGGKSTVILVTGSLGNGPRWVRSDIARRYGLKRSYFQRLIEGEPYSTRNPVFITHVK